MSGRARKPWSGARSGRVMERERNGEQTKLTAQISLKGDASLLVLWCAVTNYTGFWNQYKRNHMCSRVPEKVVPVRPVMYNQYNE